MKAHPTRALLLVLVLLTGGCTSRPTWGHRATVVPSWSRVQRAAVTAATDPQTWAPLAGAALLQLGDADEDIATWASDNTPVFGSRQTAADVSDVILGAAPFVWGASLLATPSGPGLRDGLWPKAKGGALETVGILASGGIATLLKDTTNRTRPDGTDDRSFPSGHAYAVSTFMTLTRRHAEATPMTRWQRDTIAVSTTAATAVTAWARVEGERHFPSDVLAGWGLSNFFAVLFHDSFIGGGRVRARAGRGGFGLGLRYDL